MQCTRTAWREKTISFWIYDVLFNIEKMHRLAKLDFGLFMRRFAAKENSEVSVVGAHDPSFTFAFCRFSRWRPFGLLRAGLT